MRNRLNLAHKTNHKVVGWNSAVIIKSYNCLKKRGTPNETLREQRGNTEVTLRDTTKELKKERMKELKNSTITFFKIFHSLATNLINL